nr:hypothetical protein [uncultured Cohaesibacter sp.]
MTMQTGKHNPSVRGNDSKKKETVAWLLAFSLVSLASHDTAAQTLLYQQGAALNRPVLNMQDPGGDESASAGQNAGAQWLLQSERQATPLVIEAGRETMAPSLLAADTSGQKEGETSSEAAPAAGTSMPPSMTSPLLPNVPSSLNQDQLTIPAQTGEAKIGEPIIEVAPSDVSPATDKEATAADMFEGAEANSEALSPEEKTAVDIEEAAHAGPALRKRFSALFTEQRPFLLYSQDASITYLMPNALVDHPKLSRYLRTILEERALSQWQTQRQKQLDMAADANASTAPSDEVLAEERPALVITGRVEDRFYSQEFSSLYLEEDKSVDGQKQLGQIMSVNFNNVTNQPFGLQDLFQAKDSKELDGTIKLIDTYIQTDIVRQKSIRLGTLVRPDQDAWLKDLKPSLTLLQNFTLVPSRDAGKIAGLAFHFNPGILGAEADGQYDVYVPAAIFSAAISEQFAPYFGGEALRISRHNAKGFSSASVNIEGLKSGAELGGDMLIEGEVPGNWCDGFHLTLIDKGTEQIITEGVVKLLPDLPTYGLASHMMRFRAELSVSGDGEKPGTLFFEPYDVEVRDDHVILRPDSACDPQKPITSPNPLKDQISLDVNY